MTLNAFWEDEPHTIYRLDIEGQWRWDELHPILQRGIDESNKGGYTLILNYIGRVNVPPDMLSMGRMGLQMIPPNLNAVVSVVGNHRMLKTVNAVFRRVYGARSSTQFLDQPTLNDALLWIREHQSSDGTWIASDNGMKPTKDNE